MAQASASLGNRQGTKQLLQDYVNGQWDLQDTKKAQYVEMQVYYDKYIKHLRPEAIMVKDERGDSFLKVKGLEELTNGK